MKINAAFIPAFFISINAYCQGPQLNLVGGSPSLVKGNINTEILSQVIQKKQEEVKQFVFRNTIVKNFNEGTYKGNLKNYATYSYIYSLMDVMTSGKNKTVITKSIIQSSSEFAYTYGMVLYIQNTYRANKTPDQEIGDFKIGGNITADAKVISLKDSSGNKPKDVSEGDDVTLSYSDRIKDFNFLIDACYDVLINNPELHPRFKFTVDKNSELFKTWYSHDNVYKVAYEAASEDKKQQYRNFQSSLITKIAEFNVIIDQFQFLQETARKVPASRDEIEKLIGAAADVDQQYIKDNLNALVSKQIVNTSDIDKIQNFVNQLNKTSAILLPLFQYYTNLKKSDFIDFTLTKDQYYAMKYLTMDFIKLSKNYFKNNVVSAILDFMLENTLVEYTEVDSNMPKTELAAATESAKGYAGKGYLYVDIDALISTIYQKFKPTERSNKYFGAFLTLGVNQGIFLNSNNTLAKNENGLPKSLNQIYFASEKIGFKYKIANQRYTRSFAPGESYTYYTSRLRSWKRPMPKTLVADYYISVYASGILYNIINTKTDDNFNYAILGSNLGITLFNGLSFNAGLACPYTKNRLGKDNWFFNFGIDIPIIDYISALTK